MNLNELYIQNTQKLCSIQLALSSFSEWFQKRYDQFLEFISTDENINLSVPFVSEDASGNTVNKVVLLSKTEFDAILNRDLNFVFDLHCADGTTLSTDSITVDTLIDSVFECGKSAAVNSGLFQYLSTLGSNDKINITDVISTIKTKVNVPDNDASISDLTTLITGAEMTKESFLSIYFKNTQNSFNVDDLIFNIDQYEDFSLLPGLFVSVSADLITLSGKIVEGFKNIVQGLGSIVSAIKDGFSWIMNRINPGLLQDYEINEKENGGLIDIPVYHTILPLDSDWRLLFTSSNDWYTWDTLGNNYHYRVDFSPYLTYREIFTSLINSETKYIEIIRDFHIIRMIYLPDADSIDVQIYLTNQGCDQYGQYYSLLPSDDSNSAVLTWIYDIMDKVEHMIYKYPCVPQPIPVGSIMSPYWMEHGYSHLFYEGNGFTSNPAENKPINLINDLNFINNSSFLTNPYSNDVAASLLRYTFFQYMLSYNKEETTGRLYVDGSLYQTALDNSGSTVNADSFFPYNKVPAIPTLCHCQTTVEIVNEWKIFVYKAVAIAAIVAAAVVVSKSINRIRRNNYLKKVKANAMANAYLNGEVTYDEFAPYFRKARKYQKLCDLFAPSASFIDGITSENDTKLSREIKSVGVLVSPTF